MDATSRRLVTKVAGTVVTLAGVMIGYGILRQAPERDESAAGVRVVRGPRFEEPATAHPGKPTRMESAAPAPVRERSVRERDEPEARERAPRGGAQPSRKPVVKAPVAA